MQVSRKELAQIIEARVEEIFSLVLQEIKRSGYDGLLPAGMVLTGGDQPATRYPQSGQPGDGLTGPSGRPENLIG